MSDRYAIQVRWNFRDRRYVARSKRFPDVIAYGASPGEAIDAMAVAIGKHIARESKR
jgi:predicted RNase H-like HicB family nuclease